MYAQLANQVSNPQAAYATVILLAVLAIVIMIGFVVSALKG